MTLQVLGTPSREEIHAMNPNYTEFKFPQVRSWLGWVWTGAALPQPGS